MADQWDNAGDYALRGAGTGAAIGTVLAPGVGTAIGAGAGALAGGIYGYLTGDDEEDKKRLAAMAAEEQARATRQYAAPMMDPALYDRQYGRQNSYLDMAEAAARGTVPSAAEIMLRGAMDRNAAGYNSMASSGRGGVSPALLSRMAMDQTAESNQRGMQDLAILRAREQEAARNAYGSAIYGARGQDIGVAGANQGSQMSTNALNQRGFEYGYGAGQDVKTAQIAQDQKDRDARDASLRASGEVIMKGVALNGGAPQNPSAGTGLPPGYEPMLPNEPYQTTAYVPPAPYSTGGNPISGYAPTQGPAFGDGGFVSQPTQAIVGDKGPEAIVPIRGPEDAALAAQMIERARQKQAAGDYGARMGDLAVQMTGGAAPVNAAAPAPLSPSALLRAKQLQDARDRATRFGQLAVQMTGGR